MLASLLSKKQFLNESLRISRYFVDSRFRQEKKQSVTFERDPEQTAYIQSNIVQDRTMDVLQKYGETSFRENIDTYFDQGAELSNLAEDKLAFIKTPNVSLKLTIPVRRDDGSYSNIHAFRTHHTAMFMPTIGGVRLSSTVGLAEVESLGMLSAIKNALADLPFGGAAGGVCISRREHTNEEIQRVLTRWVVEARKHHFIGASHDIWDVDYGTTPRYMDTMANAYNFFYGGEMDYDATASVVGKSPWNNGLDGRIQAPGRYVSCIIRRILDGTGDYRKLRGQAKLTKSLEGKRVMIQGFGTVGYWTAVFLRQHGAIIEGVVTSSGSLFNINGLNPDEVIDALNNYKKTGKADAVAKLGEFVTDDSVLYRRADILIPCALECSIHKGNVGKLNAKMVVEAANGAITPTAAAELEKKGVPVVPDIVCGTGGTVASYFEYLCNIDKRKQSLTIRKWEEKSKLDMMMMLERLFKKAKMNVNVLGDIGEKILEGPKEKDLLDGFLESTAVTAIDSIVAKCGPGRSMRDVAYMIAIQRINELQEIKHAAKGGDGLI